MTGVCHKHTSGYANKVTLGGTLNSFRMVLPARGTHHWIRELELLAQVLHLWGEDRG